MPRPKRDEVLRHEKPAEEEVFVNFHDDDEDGFGPLRESKVIEAPQPKPKRDGRGKRSLEDMMASQPNEIAQSLYALERIAAAEDTIVKVLELCTPEARALVLKQRPSLKKYAPEE